VTHMIITTEVHSDDYGLTVTVRGNVSQLDPAVLAARIADDATAAIRVLVIPPDPDLPTPPDVAAEVPDEPDACHGCGDTPHHLGTDGYCDGCVADGQDRAAAS
jgi:hypothetical protein